MKKEKKDTTLWYNFHSAKTKRIKNNARNVLIERYYPLVEKIAAKLTKRLNWHVSKEELTSFGIDGLYVAIRRFDITKGVKFESYASIRIRGSMIDGIRKEDLIPRSVRINNNKFEKIKSKLETEKNYRITDYDVLKELGITEKEYFSNLNKFHPVTFTSIDGTDIALDGEQNDFKQEFSTYLTDYINPTPDSKLKRKEFFNKLLGKNFTALERMIIYLYYYKDYTMGMISKKINISESRISQIHKAILPKIKEKINRNPNYFSKDINIFIKECNDSSLLF